MRTYRACIALLSVLVILALGGPANADPCGMVPPISIAGVVPIERVGLQKTYVFYKNGIETFVIRPGYRGRVDNFGMLIPFPTPPGIRKVPDEIFSHIAAAVDPPEVVVDLRPRYELLQDGFSNARSAGAGASEKKLKFDAVRVLRQEAIGMYEVAVLEAGSASALNRWMDDHGYKYPKGMDGVCQEYVESSWCFVAVKTRVGQKAGVDPRPGLREVDAKLPPGATFDGNVQAMGFRFEVDEFVVPMRLAAFNAGELRNVVYIVTDVPQRINNIPEKYVVRQIPGEEFFKNLTAPLAVRVLGGEWDDVPQARRDRLAKERDPGPHNGLARALFASDLLAARTGHLTHTFEEAEKELLRISERLLLRGPEIDRLHGTALAEERDKTIASALADLKGMTLTVVDGDFPRDVLARENLTFSTFTMPRDKNKPESYDSKLFGPTTEPQGKLYKTGALGGGLGVLLSPRGFWIASVVLLGYAVTRWLRRRTGVSGGGNATTLTSWAVLPLAFVCGMPSARADDTVVASLVARLSDPAQSEGASKALVALGEEAVVPLYAEAVEGLNLPTRGWAIICLAQIGGEGMDGRLSTLQENARQSELVRTWAAAGRVRLARTTSQLTQLAQFVPGMPALGRPIGKRLVGLLGTGGAGDSANAVADWIQLSIKIPALQQTLATQILASPPEALVQAMATAKDQQVRRQAAAYLATAAAQGNTQVATAVVKVYRFDPEARAVPWHGGPLFVPGIQWQSQKAEARALAEHLIKWFVFCDRNTLSAEMRQLHNNLRSLQLARAAGYPSRGGSDIEAWLKAWGQVAGVEGVEGVKKILEEQGVAREPRYVEILEGL
jgi:hypothetical protein